MDMGNNVAELSAKIARTVAPEITARFEKEANTIFESARKIWPIGPPKKHRPQANSKKALKVSTAIEGNAVKVSISNDASGQGRGLYAFKIKSDRQGKSHSGIFRSPWNDDVKKPMRKASKRIIADIGDKILKKAGK